MSDNATITKGKRGPKPGSKRRSRQEIVASQFDSLLGNDKIAAAIQQAIRNGVGSLEAIKAILVANAQTVATTSQVVPERLKTVRADRKPLNRALRKLETRRRRLEQTMAEIEALEPFEAGLVSTVSYLDHCEKLLQAAIDAGQSVDSVTLPARPVVAGQLIQRFTPVAQDLANAEAAGIEDPGEDDEDDEDDEDSDES